VDAFEPYYSLGVRYLPQLFTIPLIQQIGSEHLSIVRVPDAFICTSSLRLEMTTVLINSITKLLVTMLILRSNIAFKKSCKPFNKLHIASLTRASCAALGIVGKNENDLLVFCCIVTNDLIVRSAANSD
jgi:hypothetical protein